MPIWLKRANEICGGGLSPLYSPLSLHSADVTLAAHVHKVTLAALGEEPLSCAVAVPPAVKDDDGREPGVRDVLDLVGVLLVHAAARRLPLALDDEALWPALRVVENEVDEPPLAVDSRPCFYLLGEDRLVQGPHGEEAVCADSLVFLDQ